ncbi:uncharacterized protein LOC142502547 isoform X3 [Ascaphus truei]|uniref:uncharacterized protein LOC142502547 isoform X3 n=1 Tax=Ascaphus truei TaxID=8439 RepID=UPI003F59F40F
MEVYPGTRTGQPGSKEMYPRGADRGWHRGNNSSFHHHRDVQPVPELRNHHPPYRGGYHSHREHGSYAPGYHDYHDDSSHDYHGGPYSDYHERPYHDDDRPYPEYRDGGYYREERPDSGHHKGAYYRGGYSGRGDTDHYRGKKRSSKRSKTLGSEHQSSGRATPTKPTPAVRSVVHVPARTVLILTGGESSGDESKKKPVSPQAGSAARECSKPACDTQAESAARESLEATCDVNQKSPTKVKDQAVGDIKTETATEPTQESVTAPQTPEEGDGGIRAETPPHSVERDVSFSASEEGGEEGTCVGTRVHGDEIPESREELVQIPLLDGWTDVPLPSPPCGFEQEAAGADPGQECDGARALRTAFILTRKEEIELAYAQDCRTFALVASTLLKKDPSLETALASALRSSLQEIASRCVRELRSFIASYDAGSSAILLTDTANRSRDAEV